MQLTLYPRVYKQNHYISQALFPPSLPQLKHLRAISLISLPRRTQHLIIMLKGQMQ